MHRNSLTQSHTIARGYTPLRATTESHISHKHTQAHTQTSTQMYRTTHKQTQIQSQPHNTHQHAQTQTVTRICFASWCMWSWHRCTFQLNDALQACQFFLFARCRNMISTWIPRHYLVTSIYAFDGQAPLPLNACSSGLFGCSSECYDDMAR